MANARTKRPRGRPRDEDLAQRRREEILEVATRLFAARGFPAMDVQDVADALGVGKGTVYRYFPTKRELFLAAADRAMRLLKEHIDAAAEGADDALAQIEAPVEAYLGFFAAHPEFAELFIGRRRATRPNHESQHLGHHQQHHQAAIGVDRSEALVRERTGGGFKWFRHADKIASPHGASKHDRGRARSCVAGSFVLRRLASRSFARARQPPWRWRLRVL